MFDTSWFNAHAKTSIHLRQNTQCFYDIQGFFFCNNHNQFYIVSVFPDISSMSFTIADPPPTASYKENIISLVSVSIYLFSTFRTDKCPYAIFLMTGFL